jgi:hypothetical protein
MSTHPPSPQCCGTHPADAHPVLLTVRQCAEKHGFITERGLRNWIFFAQTNGFEDALLRVGRKVLIDETRFFQWLNAQNLRRAR